MSAQEEIVALVDRMNQPVGNAPRAEMRSKGLLHRATYVLVFNSSGALFVQKRTRTKDIYPGFYDPTTGGVVLAGETYEEAAQRELEEELGIQNVPLSSHQDFYFEDTSCSVWGRIFSCVYNGSMVLQPEEVESGEFLTIQEILSRSDHEPFAPDSLEAVRLFVQAGTSAPTSVQFHRSCEP